MAPPLPAASQPSNSRMTDRPSLLCPALQQVQPALLLQELDLERVLRERSGHVERVEDRALAIDARDQVGGGVAVPAPSPRPCVSAFAGGCGAPARSPSTGRAGSRFPRRGFDTARRCHRRWSTVRGRSWCAESARSAAVANRSYRFQSLPLGPGDAPARERILRQRSSCFFWALRSRCIQNFRMMAPSSASVRSNDAIRSRATSNSAAPSRRATRSSSGCEYQALRKSPIRPRGGSASQ